MVIADDVGANASYKSLLSLTWPFGTGTFGPEQLAFFYFSPFIKTIQIGTCLRDDQNTNHHKEKTKTIGQEKTHQNFVVRTFKIKVQPTTTAKRPPS